MAQDLLADHPEAIYLDKQGFYGVHYGVLGLEMLTYQEWKARPQVNAEPGQSLQKTDLLG